MVLRTQFLFLFILTVPGCRSATVKDTKDVQLVAEPAVYMDVLTRDVSINCTLPRANSTEFANVISLILSKVDPDNDNTFTEMASVTEYSHSHPDVRNSSMGGQATGHVAPGADTAYLAMKWKSPQSSVSGRYRCEAFGVDRLGHPRTSTAEIVIVEQPVDVTAALNKVKELYHDIDQLDKWKGISEKLLQRCNSGGSLYNDSYYFFSNSGKYSLSTGEDFCQSYGGYLAEVNSVSEYRHLQELVTKKLGGADSWVSLGATDEGHEGKWVYVSSGQPVSYTDWGPSTSHDSDYNGMYFHRQGGVWRMEDGQHTTPATRTLLCEIPA